MLAAGNSSEMAEEDEDECLGVEIGEMRRGAVKALEATIGNLHPAVHNHTWSRFDRLN
jgi:hypothetical protein